MRAAAAKAGRFEGGFREGAASFFYKGTNGRWHEVLSAEELELYEGAAKRELTPDCRQWLENGRRCWA
jgi:aryl sulfotransferase